MIFSEITCNSTAHFVLKRYYLYLDNKEKVIAEIKIYTNGEKAIDERRKGEHTNKKIKYKRKMEGNEPSKSNTFVYALF